MESIDKLREYGHDCCARVDDAIHDYCDEIEREIAERYMELPVDADGVPCELGDTVKSCGKEYEVWGVDSTHLYVCEDYRNPGSLFMLPSSTCHHVKPRTIEDVLLELCIEHDEHYGEDYTEGIIAKYADELRSMGVGE